MSSKWTLRSRNEMDFNGPLNTAARLIRAVCLRGKIVHQSSFNLWFILQMYIRSSKRSSVPNDLGEKTCRALSLCRIPDTSLNGRRLSNQFLWFFFLEIWQIRGLTYTNCCMTLLVCQSREKSCLRLSARLT